MQLRRLSSSHAIVTNSVFQTTFKLTYFILQPKSLGKGKVIGISGNIKYQTYLNIRAWETERKVFLVLEQ